MWLILRAFDYTCTHHVSYGNMCTHNPRAVTICFFQLTCQLFSFIGNINCIYLYIINLLFLKLETV